MQSLPNILIVDDNSTNLIYLEIILRELNANLIQASTGFEALEAVKGVELSLAILDVQMPLMNGYELAIRLNAERQGDKVPIIFLTAAYPNGAKILEGYEAGAVDYIIKPLNKVILISKINVFLEIFHQKKRLTERAEELLKSESELKRAQEYAAMSSKIREELGRAMTDLQTELEWVRDHLGDHVAVENKMDTILSKASDTMRSIELITTELNEGCAILKPVSNN